MSLTRYVEKGIAIRIGRGRFDFRQTIRNVSRHLREQAAGRQGGNGIDAVTEKALLTRSQRELADLKRRQLEGTLIPVENLRRAWGRIVRGVKQNVLAIPGQARFELPHLTPFDAEVLERLCRDALENARATDTPPAVGSADQDEDTIDEDTTEEEAA
ncbi:hypothetical protein [Microvirga sp. Mcv34]|uniref:hypothetical protein n=1 Tax=Microvirga sp. Mcv34 TaxID=2926016 RepID=UPI0021C69FA1|nr:hypothetical protein [Microvirga sp. Mcv34]